MCFHRKKVAWYRITAPRRVVYIPSRHFMDKNDLISKLYELELAVRTFVLIGLDANSVHEVELKYYRNLSDLVDSLYKTGDRFVHSIECRY